MHWGGGWSALVSGRNAATGSDSSVRGGISSLSLSSLRTRVNGGPENGELWATAYRETNWEVER